MPKRKLLNNQTVYLLKTNELFKQGLACHKNGNNSQAEAICEQVLKLHPKHFDALHLLGLIAAQNKKYASAAELISKAISFNNNSAGAHSNLGIALLRLKRFEEALACFDRAIEIKPNFADAYNNRGNTLRELKRLDDAVVSYDRAISLDPNLAVAYANRGYSLKDLKKLDEAVGSFNKSMALNPESDFFLGTLILNRNKICDWVEFEQTIHLLKLQLDAKKKACPPFPAQVILDSPKMQMQASQMWVESNQPIQNTLGLINKTWHKDKIRIGYYSADLYYHPVSIWLAEQLENHDKSKFELYAFCFRSVRDPMRDRLQVSFDHWVDVDRMSDLEVAQLSRDLEIDIALDMNGFTSQCRPGIFAARAAPIQVSHLGFPGTMGAPYIDYLISDNFALPESTRMYFTEKIAYVPCGYTYDRQRQVSNEPLTRAQFGLPDNGFVFSCQNGCQKFTPEVFSIWMEILKATPGSVLWLLTPNETALKNLQAQAREHGVGSERLIFTPKEVVPKDQENARIGKYLASYKLADLFLDTWPYNAGTTAVDALWAGLPVLTKAGLSLSARMATSALSCAEMPELIVETADEYKQMAIDLASNPDKLKVLKDKLQKSRDTTKIFDPVGNTKYIEAAYSKMYERYQADLPPDHIYVEERKDSFVRQAHHDGAEHSKDKNSEITSQKGSTMPTIKIDNKEYDLETLSQECKAQLASIQFVDQELARLQANMAALQTAKAAYLKALKSSLPVVGGSDTIQLS